MKEKSRKKTSFLIYRSDRPLIDSLTDQQAGMLFKSLFAYADTEEIVSIPDAGVNMLYRVMVEKMKRDNQKYEERCEQNSRNQQARWHKAQIQELQDKRKMLVESGLSTEVVDRQLKDAIEKSGIPPDTNVYDRIQTNTKHTDRDRDIDIDRDRDTDRDIDRVSSCPELPPEASEPKCKKDPPIDPEAPVELLPLNDGSYWRPTMSQYEEYRRLYPAVDVNQEFRNMRGWCISNPAKRKTRNGIRRFVTNWLSKEQNRGRQGRSFGDTRHMSTEEYMQATQGWDQP